MPESPLPEQEIDVTDAAGAVKLVEEHERTKKLIRRGPYGRTILADVEAVFTAPSEGSRAHS